MSDHVMSADASGVSVVPLPRLLFGDNQFFGINHMSEEKARQQAMRFQDLSAVMEVLDAAYDEGVTSFMCTTHDRVGRICDVVRASPQRYRDFAFLPSMPYAHKYADAVTENGMLGAIRQFLPDSGIVSAAVRGGRSLATKDVEGLIRLLVDAEMAMFRNVRTPVVWLQNVVVDLLLGLKFDDAFVVFNQYVRAQYDAEPGYITMNLPLALDTFERIGLDNPLVCSSINKLGFRMSGGVDAYRDVLENRRFRAVAMSVFASGAIAPDEALEWVCQLPGVESIVFGASSRAHVQATSRLVEEFSA